LKCEVRHIWLRVFVQRAVASAAVRFSLEREKRGRENDEKQWRFTNIVLVSPENGVWAAGKQIIVL
jgi:hypothetical protein